ncbi:MAG: DM13 domain-containing protein [Leptolyngbyaceae cyanobacterium bins.349]|nr:DM13 domain-containing protein [Leptolyngbyaceae cyanobacterium bins.349]
MTFDIAFKEKLPMKAYQWISLSLASLLFVSFVGQITTNQAIESGALTGSPTGSPTLAHPVASSTLMAQNPKQLTVVKSGNFKSGEHPTQGKVRIVTQNGKTFLDLDQGFKTSSMGPDLVVALHRSGNVLGATTPPAYPLKKGEYVVLAPLRQFNGAQRYAIPANLNLANFQSAVIWCRRFNATFGAATLG